ncbi:hypothetical protein ACEPAG_8979 [Sanghuangporus baumii]
MPTAFNLRLDVSDATTRDALRGPGSSSTEQIPSTSPILHSPFASSVDLYQHLGQGDADTANDSLRYEATALESGRREIDEPESHVVVVGGDVGAFMTALALAKSEQIRVTLVNVGVGSLTAPGNDDVPRGALLSSRTLSYLDELGRWRGPNYHSPQRDIPFDSEIRLSRRKGKGPASGFYGIRERIQDEGIRLRAYQLQRYSTGQVLSTQAYTVPTGEDVAMFGIEMNALLTVLHDACLSHPRIELRPRGIVRSVLPGTSAPPYQDSSISESTRDEEDKEFKSQNTDAFESLKQDRKRRRRVRESFIQLDDDEYDYLSPLPNASVPYSGTDASLSDLLRNLPSSPERGPFSAEDLPINIPSSAMKPNGEVEKAPGTFKPAIVLTSGERIEVDAVLGTEGPESKVLDAIRLGGNDGHSGEVVREDGVFKATVSTLHLLEDPDLRSLTGKLVTWLGPGRFVVAYPINYRTLYVSLTRSGGWRHGAPMIEEGEVIAHQMKSEVADWCPIVRKLMMLVDSATYEPVLDYNPLEKWVSNSGRVAVMGDAAHSLLPLTHQALNNTILDALTLGALFRKSSMGPLIVRSGFDIHSPDLVPRLLHAFEALRRPQCIRIQLTLREGRNLFLLEDGEHQRTRDETLREGGLLSEDEKRAEWLYDPFEPVELWWAREAINLKV